MYTFFVKSIDSGGELVYYEYSLPNIFSKLVIVWDYFEKEITVMARQDDKLKALDFSDILFWWDCY